MGSRRATRETGKGSMGSFPGSTALQQFHVEMAMAGADPFAIQKAMGHKDIKRTVIYVSLGKSHIREQVEKLNGISLPNPKESSQQVES